MDDSVTDDDGESHQLLSDQLEKLRDTLLLLEPTGEHGFEGLIAVALKEITGIPFRLSGSGSQYGVDGKPVSESDSVCFEAKRYDGKIPRNEVLSKVAELSISDGGNTDIWVLGATSSVSSQLADDVRKLGEEKGIGIFILDWTDIGIPQLAVALAMAETATTSFLEKNLSDKTLTSSVRATLKATRSIDAFAGNEAQIRSALQEPSMGIGIARLANSEWLCQIFSSKQQARRFFGQPLAPLDLSGVKTMKRNELVCYMRQFLTDKADGRIVAVHGDEGNGKSWLVAQSWFYLRKKPLMVVLTADDLVDASPTDDLAKTIICKLIQQTDNRLSESASKRWHKRWQRWLTQEPTNEIRLVLFIDGLNQRPRLDWARLVDAIASELNSIGGRLIITTRSLHFRDQIKRRLVSPFTTIEVPQWSEEERDAILSAADIKGDELQPAVATSLRNPRLLSIALELMQEAQIMDFNELSPSRLLFEHIRASERDAPHPMPAHEFAQSLRNHATAILSRIDSQERDDLTVFEGEWEAVIDGRFFVPVVGDPTRYALADDGLSLALGFAIVDQLRNAHRNRRDLDAMLSEMIEPISTLDAIAEAVMAGLTIACLDENCLVEISAAIIRAFAEVQNPNTDHFSAFHGLSRQCSMAFTKAARDLCLAGGFQPNFDWIEGALHAAKTDDLAWCAISEELRSWMAHYSLLPDRGMLSHPSRDSAEKVEIERKKRVVEIEQGLRSLSRSEKNLLKSLHRKDDGNLSVLVRFAFKLIAGKAVAPFAQSFVQWSFANALNFDRGAPYKEFLQLVRFNRSDWSDGRAAILEACHIFEAPDASNTGKRALVRLLQATGDPQDALRADRLVAEFSSDRPQFAGWRLVEKYCASDPCDPRSQRPDNIAVTASNFAAIDVTKIRVCTGSSAEDHFFSMACPGVARFVPAVAVDKHREFVADVLCRRGFELHQGVIELRRHNALLTRDHALYLVKHLKAGTNTHRNNTSPENDRWIVSQYCQFLAFPQLKAQEQLELLLSQPQDGAILSELMEVAKPLDEAAFETALRKAYEDDDECGQFRTLAFGASTDTPISEGTRKILRRCVHSDNVDVRAQTLRLIARLGDRNLINMVLKSGWTGAKVQTENYHEGLYGSAIVMQAAECNLIQFDQALDRLCPQFYGWAAKRLSSDVKRELAARVGASILTVVDLKIDDAIPDIEIVMSHNDHYEPSSYSVSERPPDSDDPLASLRRSSESNELFEERRNHILKAFEVFKEKLTRAKAQILLDGLRFDDFDEIAAANWQLADSWYETFVNLPGTKLDAISNLGHLLAHALSAQSPDKATRLFTLLNDSEPFVRIAFDRARIPLDSMAIWSAPDEPRLNTLRFKRLDRIGNDHKLALEVLAAVSNCRELLLQSYIEKRLGTSEPAKICRALMVAGFSTHSEFMEDVLDRYRETAGFIGRAYAAAMYAYERNIWAEHWFRKMYETEKAEDFWRYSILFGKIVDGRFDYWKPNDRKCGQPFRMFWPSVESQLKHRLKQWQGHRKGKLFGDDAPASIFIGD